MWRIAAPTSVAYVFLSPLPNFSFFLFQTLRRRSFHHPPLFLAVPSTSGNCQSNRCSSPSTEQVRTTNSIFFLDWFSSCIHLVNPLILISGIWVEFWENNLEFINPQRILWCPFSEAILFLVESTMNAPSPAHDEDPVEDEEHIFLDENDIIHEIPVDEEGHFLYFTV